MAQGIYLLRSLLRFLAHHYVAARLPMLMVDPILIEQVLVNLMKNAAESVDLAQRPLSGRNVELKVIPRMEEGLPVVEFSVSDSGRGLAPEVMERLFEAFFSTKPEGMGIGLNLCRSIVESHQGRMKAENLTMPTKLRAAAFPSGFRPVPSEYLHEFDSQKRYGLRR